jgi:hypothetical protein
MNSKRIISTLITALAVLGSTAPPAAAEPSRNLSLERAKARFAAAGTVSERVPISPAQAEGGGGGTCWGVQLDRSEGWSPYNRHLFLYTVWCGSSGKITYRSSSVWTSHDFACWTTNGPHVARTYGGAGWSLVEVQAWAEIACHSPSYWPTFHDTLMMRVRYYPNGWYQTVAWD